MRSGYSNFIFHLQNLEMEFLGNIFLFLLLHTNSQTPTLWSYLILTFCALVNPILVKSAPFCVLAYENTNPSALVLRGKLWTSGKDGWWGKLLLGNLHEELSKFKHEWKCELGNERGLDQENKMRKILTLYEGE